MFIHLVIIVVSFMLVENVSISKGNLTHPSTSKARTSEELFGRKLLSLVDDIGQSNPNKIYQKLYNNFERTSICFKQHIYAKEDNHKEDERYSWREFELTFDSPGRCCNESGTDKEPTDDNEDYIMFNVHFPNGSEVPLRFKTIKQTKNFTLRINTQVNCLSGEYLTKSYYEWPNSNRTKVIITLSNGNKEDNALTRDIYKEFSSKNKNGSDDDTGTNLKGRDASEKTVRNEVLSNIGDGKHNLVDGSRVNNSNPGSNSKKGSPDHVETSILDIDITSGDNSDELEPKGDDLNSVETTDETLLNQSDQPNTELVGITSSTIDDDDDYIDANQTDISDKIVRDNSYNDSKVGEVKETHLKDNYHSSIEEDSHSGVTKSSTKPKYNLESFKKDRSKSLVKSYNANTNGAISSSSGLNQLLSGKWFLPNFPNLGEGDKIILKGDIIVSRKHYNKMNDSDIEEPLYVIHEGTQIEKFKGKKEQ